jgi:hypothetical protein
MSRARTEPFKVSVVELTQDKGWIGQALRRIPDELLREADRRAEQDACWKEKHHDPNRLPFPDPWQFFIDLPDGSPLLKRICRAAQSQIVAFRQISRLAMGVATANTDWQQVNAAARAIGDNRRAAHAANKAANALSHFSLSEEIRREWVESNPALQEGREADAANWLTQRRAALIHRGKRRAADTLKPLPRWATVRADFPLETLLSELWVRIDTDGTPGLMFWRNEALTKLVLTLRQMPQTRFCNRGYDYIKNFRQNLGLTPVSDSDCMIWDVKIDPCAKGGWIVKGMERNGNLVFQRHFRLCNIR